MNKTDLVAEISLHIFFPEVAGVLHEIGVALLRVMMMMVMKVMMKVSFIRWGSQQPSFGQKGKNTFLLIRDDMYALIGS